MVVVFVPSPGILRILLPVCSTTYTSPFAEFTQIPYGLLNVAVVRVPSVDPAVPDPANRDNTPVATTHEQIR